MTLERKIEAALENHFLFEGWSVNRDGDHFAEWESDMQGGDLIISINLTECAKQIAKQIAAELAS